MVFETRPAEDTETECEIEEALIGYREYDESRCELQEYHHKPVDVMVVGLQAMQEGHQ